LKSLRSLCALAAGALIVAGCNGGEQNPYTGPGPSGVLNLYANGSSTPVSSSTSRPYTLTLSQTVTIKVTEAFYDGGFSATTTSGAPCFGVTGSGDTFVVSGNELGTCEAGAGAIGFTDSYGHSTTMYLNAL